MPSRRPRRPRNVFQSAQKEPEIAAYSTGKMRTGSRLKRRDLAQCTLSDYDAPIQSVFSVELSVPYAIAAVHCQSA